MSESAKDAAIARAEADALEIDRKINMLNAEQARLEMQRVQFTRERDRIRAFIEMYQRYSAPAPGAQTEENNEAEGGKPIRRRVRLITRKVDRKPENIPPMTAMIKYALRTYRVGEERGLEPKHMTDFIRQKWWPSVKSESVGPIAWRMVQNGQLKKEGERYVLPS